MDEEVSDMGGIQEQNIQEKQNRETVQGENGDM